MLDQGPEDIFVLFAENILVSISMSFMTSAASLKSNIRNADAAFNVLVCFGLDPPPPPPTNSTSVMAPARYKVSRDTPLVCVNEYKLPVTSGKPT